MTKPKFAIRRSRFSFSGETSDWVTLNKPIWFCNTKEPEKKRVWFFNTKESAEIEAAKLQEGQRTNDVVYRVHKYV